MCRRCYLIFVSVAAVMLTLSTAPLRPVAAANVAPKSAEEQSNEKTLTPEQRMQKRFPQPVRIGDLIGLPLLDDDGSTIGYVSDVVRSSQGKIFLIVPYRARLGWSRIGWGKRAVAVPIEVVAINGRQLASVDMSREDFDAAPTWAPSQAQPIAPDEKTLIALGRR